MIPLVHRIRDVLVTFDCVTKLCKRAQAHDITMYSSVTKNLKPADSWRGANQLSKSIETESYLIVVCLPDSQSVG